MIHVLVVPGQTEELILGSNAIKSLLTLLRTTVSYWKLMTMPSGDGMDESFQFCPYSLTQRDGKVILCQTKWVQPNLQAV